jgi:hypothetical protein
MKISIQTLKVIILSLLICSCQNNKYIESYIKQVSPNKTSEQTSSTVSEIANQINKEGMSEVTAGKVLLAARGCDFENTPAQIEFIKFVISLTAIDRQTGQEEKYSSLICDAISSLNKTWLTDATKMSDLANMSVKIRDAGNIKTTLEFYSAISKWSAIIDAETKSSFTPNGIGKFILAMAIVGDGAQGFVKSYFQKETLRKSMNKLGFNKVIGGDAGFDNEKFQVVIKKMGFS